MGTFSKIRDALTETAQDMRDKAGQVRDAVVDTAKETRDRAFGMADEAIASGEKVREMIAGDLDALQLLKKDHEMVSSMFTQIEALDSQSEDKEGIFAQLKYELSTHALVEEKLFYPALARGRRKGDDKEQKLDKEELDERRDLINEANAEHALVKQLLSELTAMPMNTPEWKAKLTVLRENVEHHVDEEENELFDIAREVLDEEQLMKLGAQLEQEKLAMAEAGRPDERDEGVTRQDEPQQKAGGQRSAAKKGRARSGAAAGHRTH